MEVGEFLRAAARSAAPQHCSTDAADWCIQLGHPDFAWAWRGVMSDRECEAATMSDPLLALWDEGIGNMLPIATGEPRAGDIAVVSKMGLHAGAIFTGARWAIRSGRGMAYVPVGSVIVIKSWRP